MSVVFKFLVITFTIIEFGYSANILGIFWFPSVSHQVVFQPIYKELSLKGHKVTVVTPNPLKDKTLTNLTEIDISYVYKHHNKLKGLETNSYIEFLTKAGKLFVDVITDVLSDTRIKKLCVEQADLVMTETIFPTFLVFGAKCKAPTVSLVSMDALLNQHSALGNPIHPALFADNLLPFSESMSILQKIKYTYYFLWFKFHHRNVFLVESDALIKKHLGKGFPSTENLEKDTSMLFINTNLVVNRIRPTVPNVIPLGFMHLRPLALLPKDMQTILDNATHGAVYFSLGSNVRSSELPATTVKLIKDALSEVPYTVLWKWESDDVPDVGPNVVTRKWFPQQDILAHKNLRGFVTQGGLQSTEEAIHYGVPMVGIPFLGDQEMNVKQSMKQGIALYLDHSTMTKDELKKNIIEIMEDPKYFKRIQELKEIAQDQPMTGLERAVWWSEYVIRHKGAKHLRSPVADMPVWEYLMLDVIAVVLTALIITLVVSYKVLKFLFGLVFKKSKKIKKS